MLTIGFANKFYTLWDVMVHYEVGPNYRNEWTSYSFIKNISMDRDTAFAKYPEADFDEYLRGHHASFNSQKTKVWTGVDTFRWGMYEGDNIADCVDTDYIAWYFGYIADDHQEYVRSVLESRGMTIEGDRVISAEELAERARVQNKFNQVISKVENGEGIEVLLERNLDENGEILIDSVLYKFPDFVVRDYRGYPYALPTILGKGKRVKGKTLKITGSSYRQENPWRLEVTVSSFEIL